MVMQVKLAVVASDSLSSAHDYRSVAVYTFGENNQFQLFPVRGKTTVNSLTYVQD